MRRSKANGVTSLFAGVTKICGTSVARFFKNRGTGGKKRHNSNKNGELRVPRPPWDRLGTGGTASRPGFRASRSGFQVFWPANNANSGFIDEEENAQGKV